MKTYKLTSLVMTSREVIQTESGPFIKNAYLCTFERVEELEDGSLYNEKITKEYKSELVDSIPIQITIK